MRLPLVLGYGALAAVIGVACGGHIAGSPGEPVQAEGGAPRGSVDAAADASDVNDGFVAQTPDPGDGVDRAMVTPCCFEYGLPVGCAGFCPHSQDGGGLPNTGSDPAAWCQACCSGAAGLSGCAGTSCPCPSGRADAGALPPTFDGGGEVCVKIDVSTYDQSCRSDSDCMAIASTACQSCACTDATINVDGRDRYNATLAQLPPAILMDSCWCPNEHFPKCEQGICTYGYSESAVPWQ